MPTLTWTGKEDALRAASLVPFRLLEPHTTAKGGIVGDPKAAQDNLLIQGDNLEALKALLPYYAGRVKCIYIDPPYNSKSAFGQYDDNLEHSKWLSMMYPRLQLLYELLHDSGVIFVSIDDREHEYLKCILDEIWGRTNYLGPIIWEKKKKPSFLSNFGVITENILVYAKRLKASPNLLFGETTRGKKYPINNAGNGVRTLTFPANSVSFNMADQCIEPMDMSEGNIITKLLDKVVIVGGKNRDAFRLEGEWRYSQATVEEIISSGESIRISKVPFRPNHIKTGGEPKKLKNLLSVAHYKMATYEDATAESEGLFGRNSFDYPKPELLVETLIESVAEEGDLILDSFLGSGTTAAVAHKLGLHWIGIEMGDHAVTHCLPRLQKVIDGEQGGISEVVSWKGGGGFRFVKLGDTLFDAFGRLNPKVKFADLAAFVWWRETKAPAIGGSIKATSPFLGVHEGRGLYLLYNGILGDKRSKGGNVLTPAVLASLPNHDGPRIVYAEATTYSPSSLSRMNITFKQIPYDLGSMPLLAEGALEYAAGLMPEAPQALATRAAGAGEEGEHV